MSSSHTSSSAIQGSSRMLRSRTTTRVVAGARNQTADVPSPFFLWQITALPLELIAMIATYLDPTTLATCVQVCSDFQLLWIPFLYHTMVLVDEEKNHTLKEEVVEQHFKSVSHHIRQFASAFGWRHGILLVSEGVKNLNTLELVFEEVLISEWLDLTELVAQLVESNAGLLRLSLTGASNWFAFPLLLDTARQLTHLALDFRGVRLPPMTLQLENDDFVDGGRFPALKWMSLANFNGSDEWLLLLLKECSGLRDFEFSQQQYWTPSEESRLELPRLLRGVENVVWHAEEIRGEDLSKILELGSSESKDLSISAPEVGSLAPLVESAASIRLLTLDGVILHADLQNEFQKFLEAATKLKELRVHTTTPCSRGGLVVTPLVLLGSTSPLLGNHVPRAWGCSRTLTRLEVLVQIDYPPFKPEEAHGVDQLLNPVRFENDRQHALVYSQLGLLVHLVHLRLGLELASDPEDEEETALGGFQRYSVLFSLRSGLRQLRDLKALETLDVRWTRHEIGTLELDWMSKNWPKMKAILGLAHLPSDADRFRQRQAMLAEAWVSNHPLGIGCGYYRK